MKIFLTRTVVYKGRHYPPGDIIRLPKDVAEDLIDKEAAEPVYNAGPAKTSSVVDSSENQESAEDEEGKV